MLNYLQDSGGNITAYQYDEAGNVIKVTNPDNYAVTFEYDATNHETRRIDAKQHATTRSVPSDCPPRYFEFVHTRFFSLLISP